MTSAGKHCESGDILIKDVHLPEDVAPGDLLVHPRDRRLQLFDGQQLQPDPAAPGRDGRRRRATEIVAARPTTTS